MAFSMITSQGVTFLASELLDGTQGVRHAFSTRVGGGSAAPFNTLNLGAFTDDAPGAVDANWTKFSRSTAVEGWPIVHCKQVHGESVIHVDGLPKAGLSNLGDGDALVTRRPGVALAVFSADCIPVLLAGDSPAKIVGAAHAGWRGVVADVVTRTAQQMLELSGLEPGDIQVSLGPHIRSCCFEVGPEVVAQFRDAGLADADVVRAGEGDRAHLDLGRIVSLQLEKFGVPSHQIEVSTHCTRCRSDLFFSYRRDGAGRGCLGAIVGLLPRV